MKTKLSYATALNLAIVLVERFSVNSIRIEIAGSIRRQKPEIGDIELVIIPAPALYEQLDTLLADGKIQHVQPKRWGQKLRSFLFDSGANTVQCDLFLQPDPATWGVNMMIRTGSSDFSRRMVTKRSLGGWMPDAYKIHEARVWLGLDTIPTPEETDVFRMWSMEYVAPELRTDAYKPTLQQAKVEASRMHGGLFDAEVGDIPTLHLVFTYADAERVTAEYADKPLPSSPDGPAAAARQAILERSGWKCDESWRTG